MPQNRDFLAGATRVQPNKDFLAGATPVGNTSAAVPSLRLRPLVSTASNLVSNVFGTEPERSRAGLQEMKQPGVMGKIQGVGNYLLGGVPLVRPIDESLTAAQNAFRKGQYGRGAGESALTAGMVAAGPLLEEYGPAAMTTLRDLVPTKGRAGELFESVGQRMAPHPVNVMEPIRIAGQAKDLADTGMTAPGVVSKTLDYATPSEMAGPRTTMPWQKARDFYSSANELSTEEKMGAKPRMHRQMTQLARAYDQSLRNAAGQIDPAIASDYDKAMKMYRRASRIGEAGKSAGKALLKSLVPVGGAGLIYEILRGMGR